MTMLGTAERLKLELLSTGISILPDALSHIIEVIGDRDLTPADYASTSGVILRLDPDVWVNAPLAAHNPNFVLNPRHELALGREGLVVRGAGVEVRAAFWLPPAYHDEVNETGVAYTAYAFTHADRVRVSPIEGCAYTCKFCDLPYEFRYRRKDVAGIVDSVRRAVEDPIQPAAHCLVSGGTPTAEDEGYLVECYEALLSAFPDLPIDVMMVPLRALSPELLHDLGVNELSVNIEIFDRELARRLMRRKHDQGLDHYLDYLERAAGIFGPNRVRSMLLVGLEPIDSTLAGVAAIAERGAVPVLSPFRPDSSTPLRDHPAPSADLLEEVFVRAHEIARAAGVGLGPSCVPCAHNTITFPATGSGDAHLHPGHPRVIN